MAMNEVVLQTVKRMVASGIDDDSIKSTLKGINLPDKDIAEVLSAAKKAVPESGPEADDVAGEVMGEEGDAGEGAADEDEGGKAISGEGNVEGSGVDELKGHIEDTSQEQLAHHAETHQMLNDNFDKLDSLHQNIGVLHEKIDSSQRLPSEAIACLTTLDRRLSTLESAVGEAKANTAALQSLMQKIIETERQILIELQKKK